MAKAEKGYIQMSKIVNLTPHTIVVVNSDNQIVREYPSQGQARIITSGKSEESVDGISVVRTLFGGIEGLPEPDGESVFIVSMPVAQRCSDREDVIAPDTGPTAYRIDGKIIGVRQFARY